MTESEKYIRYEYPHTEPCFVCGKYPELIETKTVCEFSILKRSIWTLTDRYSTEPLPELEYVPLFYYKCNTCGQQSERFREVKNAQVNWNVFNAERRNEKKEKEND